MTIRVTELTGLPGDPPYPVQFAPNGVSTFREGYVLRFETNDQKDWVGNFQPGLSPYCSFLELHTSRVAVVARGQGYVVDTGRKECQYTFGGDIIAMLPLEGTGEFLTISSIDIARHSSTHRVWRSSRISWDGIASVELRENTLLGRARHFDDSWHDFKLCLATGQHTGGSYSEA